MWKSGSERVAVTAMGVVSPLGRGTASNLEALREGRDGVRPVETFDVSRTRCKTAGQVLDDWIADCSPSRRRLHPASLMMIAALRELRESGGLPIPELAVIGTTSGGMSYGERFYRGIMNGRALQQGPFLLANYAPQKPVLDAFHDAGWRIPVHIIANACASGTNAVGHAFNLVRSGQCRRVLCGGYDAISELVFTGFDSLQASTPELCRPFDKDRQGLVLGEGAALFSLENWTDAEARGATILAEVTGYGISTDNYHLTQPHPSGAGPQQAMERALDSAEIRGEQVDYINAHGTATLFNDATEGIAITNVCPGKPVSSTKSMMGHSLGAAGAIEAAFVVLALQHQFLPPNIHFREPDPAWNFAVIANQSQDARVECALSNSFGFGGTNATIVMQRA